MMNKMLRPEKDVKSAQHHWWPRALSQFWADEQGGVHRLSWDGKVSRARPANFGALTNAHHVKLAEIPTVWDETFEPRFGEADTLFPELITWLQTLVEAQPSEALPLARRVRPRSVTNERFEACLRCVVSLVVRSPRFRNSIRLATEHFRERLGVADPEASDSLIALNQRDSQGRFLRAIGSRGKLSVLISREAEFIFGDGFFHNFTSSANAPLGPRILVPLTPQISLFFTRPMMYPAEPRLTSLVLRPEEVSFLNDTVQIYSRDQIFYRSQQPVAHAEFKRREFREYAFNSHPGIDALEQAVASRVDSSAA